MRSRLDFLRKLILATQCRLFSVVAQCGAPPVESQMCLETPARPFSPFVLGHPRGLCLSVLCSQKRYAEPSTLDIVKEGGGSAECGTPVAQRAGTLASNVIRGALGPLLRAAPLLQSSFSLTQGSNKGPLLRATRQVTILGPGQIEAREGKNSRIAQPGFWSLDAAAVVHAAWPFRHSPFCHFGVAEAEGGRGEQL